MPNSQKVETFLNQHLATYHPEQARSSIKKLNFYGGGICEILQKEKLDLSDFTSLEELKCGGNSLVELNVSKCPHLKKLSCFQNELKNLDLSYNPALIELDCSFNELTTLDLSSNSDLEVIKVQFNEIVVDLNIFSRLLKLRILNFRLKPTFQIWRIKWRGEK